MRKRAALAGTAAAVALDATGYGAVTSYRYGRVSRRGGGDEPLRAGEKIERGWQITVSGGGNRNLSARNQCVRDGQD